MTARSERLRTPRQLPSESRAPVTVGPLVGSAIICIGAAAVGYATGEAGLIIIAMLLALIAAVAIAVNPDRATLVVVAILYSNAAAIAVTRFGVPYFAGAAFPLLLVVPFAYHIIVRRQPIVIASGLPWLIAYFVVVTIGTAFGMSADPDRAMDMYVTLVVEGLLIYFFMTNVVRSLGDLRMIVWVLLAVGCFLGVLSVHQQATEAWNDDYFGFSQVSQAALDTDPTADDGGQPRLAGPIGEKNRYAQIMVVLLPLGLFRMWGERKPILRLAAGAATAFIAFGAVLTFSRGAALGFAVTILLMTLLRYIKVSQVIALLIGVAVLVTVQPTYLERLMTIDAVGGLTGTRGEAASEDSSFRKRANETIAALLVFGDHPVTGVGRGLFPLYYGDYADEVGIASETEARQAHNLYAGILAETGLFGFIFFMAIFAATLIDLERVRRRWKQLAPEYADMAVAFSLAVVAYLTTGMFLHLAYERYLWILLALAASAAYLGLHHRPAPAVEDARSSTAAPAASRDGRRTSVTGTA